jgi:hypothetical protein
MHDVAWPWLAAAADLPWALVHASPPVWWYVLASIGVFLSLMPWPLTLRLAAVVWVFPLAMAVDSHPGEGVAEITALDVGKGTSVVVQTAQHVLVYEVGDAYGTDGRIAESILVPFLRSRGVRRIDVLVLNRLTAANGPGVTALLAEMPVDQTLVGGAAGMDLPGARPCPCDEAWDWDGVRFAGSSAGACMIRVESSGARGVLSPSATEFVRTDGAHWAVVPGRRERNGREKPAVRRSREGGATVLSTGDLGAIHFRLAPDASLQGPAAARLDSHAPWRLPSTGPAALRYDAAHPKVPWLDGKNVGNRAGRRTPDVADHSLFHRRRSDHSRTALDASGQTRPAPRADAEGVAAHRIQSGE